MEDKNQNMIPDAIDRLVLRVGLAATAALTSGIAILELSDNAVPLWVSILTATIPAALTVFSFRGAK